MAGYSIGKLAGMSGVSVRTVRYYDQIGLLRPSVVRDTGYRYYDDAALSRLQQILFYRTLDFSLDEIARVLDAKDYDAKASLRRQRDLLLSRGEQMRRMADKINHILGEETTMNGNTLDYDKLKTQYQQEARERWGDTQAFRQSQQKAEERTPAQAKDIMAQAQEIFAGFGKLAAQGAKPGDENVQALVAAWRAFIQKTQYDCTDEIFAGLAEMYTLDERFRENLDKNGAGTAALMREGMLYSLKK